MAITKKILQSDSEFMERYSSIIDAAANRIHYLVSRNHQYTPTVEVANWIISSLPSLARKTWGRELKRWRVVTMLSNARFLGAFEDLDVRSVPGKGLTTVVKPRKGKLRLVKGGKR